MLMYHPALIARNTLAKHDTFRVGVYLETNSYGISAGNVQHTSSRFNLCAELLALAQAKSSGLIPKHLHLVTDNLEPTFMCGHCREYSSEYPSMKITCYSSDGKKKVTKTVNQLLPNPFKRVRMEPK